MGAQYFEQLAHLLAADEPVAGRTQCLGVSGIGPRQHLGAFLDAEVAEEIALRRERRSRQTGSVRRRHQRADGFSWRPPQPLDWMVCDMVEQPRRVAARMAEWFVQGWCRRSIFNLKLPMKKRWLETRRSLEAFDAEAAVPVEVRARQLYHDREEITVFASRLPG